MDQQALADIIAKEEIRELVLLYSRGVDRKDIDLLRTLYARDGYDNHGKHFSGSADDYVDFLARSLPHVHVSAHCVCNHLISVNGDQGEGEVYALAYHVNPDGKGGTVEDFMIVRYVDRYRKEDGRWLFASRDVMFDHRIIQPIPTPDAPAPPWTDDASYKCLSSRVFGRGPRA
jgi:SnoaL-like protein